LYAKINTNKGCLRRCLRLHGSSTCFVHFSRASWNPSGYGPDFTNTSFLPI